MFAPIALHQEIVVSISSLSITFLIVDVPSAKLAQIIWRWTLKGEARPFLASIAAVADSFDSMTSRRT